MFLNKETTQPMQWGQYLVDQLDDLDLDHPQVLVHQLALRLRYRRQLEAAVEEKRVRKQRKDAANNDH